VDDDVVEEEDDDEEEESMLTDSVSTASVNPVVKSTAECRNVKAQQKYTVDHTVKSAGMLYISKSVLTLVIWYY